MKRLLTFAVGLLLLGGTVPAQQKSTLTAEAVFARYKQAIGSDEARAAIKTLSMSRYEYSPASPLEGRGGFELFSDEKGRFYDSSWIAGYEQAEEGYDGTKRWNLIGPLPRFNGKSAPIRIFADHKQFELFDAVQQFGPHIVSPHLDISKRYSSAEILGRTKVGEIMTIVVRGHTPHGDVENNYFGVDSGLLLRRDVALKFGTAKAVDSAQIQSSYYTEYQAIAGIQFVKRIRVVCDQGEVVFVFTSIKLNEQIDPQKFSKPPQ